MAKASSEIHIVLIMDGTPDGQSCADELLRNCPQVENRMSEWRASEDEFFMFILEQRSGRVRSMTARDLDALLSDLLPLFFASHLMPPAAADFAVASDESTRWAIYQTIEQLKTTASSKGSRQ